MTASGPKETPGLWPSPIQSGDLSTALRFSDVLWDSDGETLVWREERSDHGVLVCHSAGDASPRDLTTELSVRARVGYGGGDFTVAQGCAYFAAEGRLFRQPLLESRAAPITPADGGQCTSPTVSPDGQYLLYVHSYEGSDVLAMVDTAGRDDPRTLVQGHDFFMQPCWHPRGTQIAWVAWDHPSMPWDSAALYLGDVDLTQPRPELASPRLLAGAPGGDTAVFQPAFSPDGRYLSYASNNDDWFNLHLLELKNGEARVLVAEEAEHALPAWLHNMRTQAWRADGKAIYFLRCKDGFTSLARFDLSDQESHDVQGDVQHYTDLAQIASAPQGNLALIASSTTTPARIISVPDPGPVRIHRHSSQEDIQESYLSRPEPLSWQVDTDGLVNHCHGLYYPPAHPDYQCSEPPPTIIKIHGGPTSQYRAGYSAETQFFTSRGYAVLELNYRGSSGYGTSYAAALKENWGVSDVADTHSAVEYLLTQRLANARQIVVMGGSAGGYTVLMSLIAYPGVFRAGICRYAVSNLFSLTEDTHKFEQHYLDSLVGKLPEHHDRYRQRSPVFSAEKIEDPVAIFQGEKDQVVPRSQSDEIVESLIRQEVPHLYQIYPGEGHGWRKSATIEDYYGKVERFLQQYVIEQAH
ncbi:MAG: prolyl oligopeptidase family serine peptidase [Acidobacteriota bacterium]